MSSQEEKTSVKSEEPSSAAEEQPPQAAAPPPRRAVPPANPFDFSTMTNLLSDPSIKEMAEQIAKDPAFTEMAEQLQKTVQSPRGAAQEAAALDPTKYVSTMQQLMQNPQFVAMAERLGSALMQDPAMSSMLGGLTNPAHKEQLEARIARMKEDPSLKPILDEIESGGPAAMMKYWNDPEALQKFGRAMGVGPSSEAAAGGEHEEAEEDAGEEGEYEDESIIHHTASVGDVEVNSLLLVPFQDEKLHLFSICNTHWASSCSGPDESIGGRRGQGRGGLGREERPAFRMRLWRAEMRSGPPGGRRGGGRGGQEQEHGAALRRRLRPQGLRRASARARRRRDGAEPGREDGHRRGEAQQPGGRPQAAREARLRIE